MGRYVEFDATRLYRVDHGGEGAPIVLIHGLGGSAHDWDAVAPALTELGRVVAIDLPRFGYSPPTKIPGLRGMTGSVVAFLEEITEETGMKAVLFGNSMGGLISTFAAAERPDLVSAMVLVAPAFPPRLRDLPAVHRPTAIRLALQAAPVTGEALDAWLYRLPPRERVTLTLDWIAHKAGRVPMPVIESLVELAERRRGLPWARRAVTSASRSIAALWARPARLVEAVRRVQAPTLVVQGESDNLVPPPAVEWVCRLRSDWELVMMEDTGHVPQLDAGPRFLEIVIPWLRSQDLRPVR